MKNVMSGILLVGLLSTAYAQPENALTIAAEQAHIKTVGAIRDGAWNLWSNGEWGEYIRFTQPGTYRVSVRCHGSPVDEVWPEMAFVVDGEVRGKVSVDRPVPGIYAFDFDAAAGGYQVEVSFTNDAATDTEDRNLYISDMVVYPTGSLPVPILFAEEEMAASKAKAEAEVLARAERSIEQNRTSRVTLRVLGPDNRPVEGAAVTVELVNHDFLFGCNFYKFDRFDTADRNALYQRRFAELFNAATLGFYWRGYEWVRGEPNYDYTDKAVAWCREQGIRMKGHPLLWDHEAGRPRWTNDQQPPAPVQRQRVTDILRRFQGSIEYWEVVNEPSHCPGVTIDEPYAWAREADPGAHLIVNDYYVMATGHPPFFHLLQEAIRNGVPFDGIGIQAHEPRTMRFPLGRIQRILDRYATLGKDLHITEFTPASGGQPITGSHIQGTWDEQAQADYAVKFYTTCFAHPAVVGITWWDFCDEGSWLPGGGMLREDLTPKPVYAALRKRIKDDWSTYVEGQTGADGSISFRGFHGEYVIRFPRDTARMDQSFQVGAMPEQTVTIRLEEEPLGSAKPGDGA